MNQNIFIVHPSLRFIETFVLAHLHPTRGKNAVASHFGWKKNVRSCQTKGEKEEKSRTWNKRKIRFDVLLWFRQISQAHCSMDLMRL